MTGSKVRAPSPCSVFYFLVVTQKTLSLSIVEIVRRAYEGRIEVDSPSDSELEEEDADMSDSSSPETSDAGMAGGRQRPIFTNGFQSSSSSKRKFFRSSVSFAPIQRDVQNKLSAMNRYSLLPPGWNTL